MIKTLTSWRGFFAICIVCFHFAMHQFDQMAFSGVTFFFMLSGFLVTFRHKNMASVKQFYRQRLGRIFPLHWIALTAMIALDLAIIHKFQYGWDLPLHVVLMQSWVPSKEVFYNFSIHSWFLSSLVFCVIATPLLIKLFSHCSLKLSWCIIVAACAAVVGVSFYVNQDQDIMSYLYVFPAFRLVDYAIGMVLGISIRERHQHASSISLAKATAIEAATILIFAAFVAFHVSGNNTAITLENAPLWWIPVALIIVSATLLNNNEGIIGKCLMLPPVVWIGTISFEIYILQKLVNNQFVYAICPLFGHFGILIYDYSFAGTLPLLIITAWVVHRILNARKR